MNAYRTAAEFETTPSTEPAPFDRLISRVLDGESSDAERQCLDEQMAADPAIRAEFDALRLTDLTARHALRSALAPHTSLSMPARAERGIRVIRFGWGSAAIAACVGIFAWSLGLDPFTSRRGNPQPDSISHASLVATERPQVADEFLSDTPFSGRPQVGLRDTDRRWLIVPGRTPGQYVMIEIRNVRTHAIGVYKDF